MTPRYSFEDIRVKKEGKKDAPKQTPRKVPITIVHPPTPSSPVSLIPHDDQGGDPFIRRAEPTARPSYVYTVKDATTGRGSRFLLWLLVAGTVVFLGISIASFFAEARVTVTSEEVTMPLNVTIHTRKEAGAVPYSVLVITEESTRNIPATIQKEINRKASGTITIYNEFSTQTQRLIKNTRFEAANKKIYRLAESVVVPGAKNQNGKLTLGTLDAIVYADEPGESYNQTGVQFTLPALASSPRFTKIYAKSKTAIEGGFSGMSRTVPTEEIARTRDNLHAELSETLTGTLKAAQPEGTIFYSEGGFLIFDELVVPVDSQTPTLPITQKGTFYAVVWNRDALTRHLASSTLPSYDGAPVVIENIGDLRLVIANKNTMRIPADELDVAITGNALFAWVPPEEDIKRALAGKRRSDFRGALVAFPHIKNAEAFLRPFWQRSFPEDPADITVIVE